METCGEAMKKLVYLCSPYTHRDRSVMADRFKIVCRVASMLMGQGHMIFSPIAHSHSIAMAGGFPRHWEFWQEYDREILSHCKEMWVLKMEGWKKSVGIKAELAIAKELGLPVRFVDEGGTFVPGEV